MSDPAADTGASEPASACCAAMAELQRRARPRTEQDAQARTGVPAGTTPPETEPARSAPQPFVTRPSPS